MIHAKLVFRLTLVVLSLCAFSVGQAFGKTPTISGLSPTSGAVGTSVTISGSNFGSTQGSSTVKINGVAATPTSWRTGTIVAPVPAAATTGSVVVTVGGVASNSVTFTVTPVISTVSPTSGAVGTSVTISGSGFGTTQGSNTVKFNGVSAAPTTWGDASIVAPVPAGASTGNVVATINGVASNGVTFTVPPVLESITVNPTTYSLALGLNVQFTATGNYSDNSQRDLTSTAVWTSSNTALATVGGTGAATSHSAGSVTISATVGSIAGSSALTVTGPQLLVATIAPQNSFLPPNATQQFTATGTYSDGSTQDVTGSVTWASSNGSAATINASGLASGVGAGTTKISASINGASYTTTLTVTSPGPPTITAAVSPSPNAAGWNNTNVTVTFACTPGSYVIASCPVPVTVSTEGANQVISGTVTDNGANNATVNVTLNIDKTPPTLVVNDPTNQGIYTSSSITSDGTLSDALSGLSSLSCNGTANTPAASYSCNITLSPGLNLVVVQATDVAGNVALTKMHVVLNAALPLPTSLQVTPANTSLVVGNSQQFTAVDNQGQQRTDATWTVSNQSLATITSDTSPWLTAEAVGSVTLTATVQGVSAQAQIAILSGAPSAGTTSWTVPTLPGLTLGGILEATPWIGVSPDFYDRESTGSGSNPTLRAFTVDGQQLWQQSASNLGVLTPDGLGGITAPVTNGLIDLDGQTGISVWQFNNLQAPIGLASQYPAPSIPAPFTIRPSDGAILALEGDTQGSQVLPEYLDQFNGNSGQQIMHYLLPEGSSIVTTTVSCAPNQNQSQTSPLTTQTSPVVIDSDGNAYMEYGVTNRSESSAETCDNNTGNFTIVDSWTLADTIYVLTVTPDGTVSTQTLESDTENSLGTQSGNFGTGVTQSTSSEGGATSQPQIVIPDGGGGMLASLIYLPVSSGNEAIITHLSASGNATYQLPLNGISQLVVGDNQTAFAANGSTIVSFNMASGSINWTYQAAPQNTLSLLVSVSGGGVTAKTTTSTGTDTVLRFDPSGNVTQDAWSAASISNYGGSLWLGFSGGPSSYFAPPVGLSASPWYATDGNGGNAAKETITVSNISQAGVNQTTTIGVVNEIFSALSLSTFPGSTACNSWLNSGTRSVATLKTFVPADWAHGTITENGDLYKNYAITQNFPEGDPDSVVNDNGGFFNGQFPLGNNQFQAYQVGPQEYAGNEILGQAQISLHELGHQAVLPSAAPVSWEQNDAGNRKAIGNNESQVDKNCSAMIRALPSINALSNLPSGLLPGLSPTSGSAGTTTVTINGTNFGTSQGMSTVTFAGVSGPLAATASHWSGTQLTVTVPTGATTGNVVVTVSGVPATGPIFTVQ